MTQGWIETPQGALRYAMSGEGPVTVLLHEMGGTLESFDLVAGRLPGRVLRFDAIGYGMSSKLTGPLELSLWSDALVSLLDALGLAGPVDVAGVAVGGAAALHVAARHPDRVRGVLATSPVTGIPPERHAGLLDMADRMERHGLRPLADDWLVTGYPVDQRHDAERFATYRARWLGNDPRSFAQTYRMLARLDMSDTLPRIVCPVRMIGATRDAFRPAAAVRAAAALIPGATYAEVDGGHFLPWQDPALYLALATDWLAVTRR